MDLVFFVFVSLMFFLITFTHSMVVFLAIIATIEQEEKQWRACQLEHAWRAWATNPDDILKLARQHQKLGWQIRASYNRYGYLTGFRYERAG